MHFVPDCRIFCNDVRIRKKNGFDFTSGSFSTPLATKVDKKFKELELVPNQVIAGHSQGGLTGLGYIKKEKAEACRQGRPSNVKAFISVDSPVRGFAGLDYGYDTMRNRMLDMIGVHTRALGSTLAVIPATNLLGAAYSLLPTTWQLNLIMLFTEDMEMQPLFDTLVNKGSGSAKDIQEITDMGRLSSYVGANVGPTKITPVKYQSGTRSYFTTRSRKVWGIRIYYLVWETVPVYSYYDRYDFTPNFRNDIPIGHVVGTDKDPLRLAVDDEEKLRTIKNCIGVGYGIAGGIHTAMSVATWPFGTVYFRYNANNCLWGVESTINYVSKWGNVIGGQTSDAFISEDSQVLPGKPSDYIRRLSIDHTRSTTDERIWGAKGLVNQIKDKMGIKDL